MALMIFYGARPDEAMRATSSEATLAAASHSQITSWREDGKISKTEYLEMKAAWTLSLPPGKTPMSYVYIIPQESADHKSLQEDAVPALLPPNQKVARKFGEVWAHLHLLVSSVY